MFWQIAFDVICRLLHGHRPYWWVQFNMDKKVSLHQTPLTCETGPGNPSGHVMINVVTCLAILHLISDQLGTHSLRMGLVIRRMLKNVLLAWIAIMATSRVYISAHFPHQCALAICLGYISFYYTKSHLNQCSKKSTFNKLAMAFSLLGCAIFIHENLQKLLGFGPNWSIDMAKKYCAKVRIANIFNLTKRGSMKPFLFTARVDLRWHDTFVFDDEIFRISAGPRIVKSARKIFIRFQINFIETAHFPVHRICLTLCAQ